MNVKTLATALFLVSFSTFGNSQSSTLLLKTSGKVVIGDTTVISTPDGYSLFVQEGILTEKVKVAVKQSSEWSDDAWTRTPTITEVAESIEANQHLPEMPSAESLVKEGYDVMQMDAKLLAQIEWLWQHMIELSAENEKLRKELQSISDAKAVK